MRGIEAGRGVIHHRGVSEDSDGARPLRWSHSSRMEIFFADVRFWGEQISNSDFPAESCTCFPSILGVCVHIQFGADGDDGNGNGNGNGDGVGDSYSDYSIRST